MEPTPQSVLEEKLLESAGLLCVRSDSWLPGRVPSVSPSVLLRFEPFRLLRLLQNQTADHRDIEPHSLMSQYQRKLLPSQEEHFQLHPSRYSHEFGWHRLPDAKGSVRLGCGPPKQLSVSHQYQHSRTLNSDQLAFPYAPGPDGTSVFLHLAPMAHRWLLPRLAVSYAYPVAWPDPVERNFEFPVWKPFSDLRVAPGDRVDDGIYPIPV